MPDKRNPSKFGVSDSRTPTVEQSTKSPVPLTLYDNSTSYPRVATTSCGDLIQIAGPRTLAGGLRLPTNRSPSRLPIQNPGIPSEMTRYHPVRAPISQRPSYRASRSALVAENITLSSRSNPVPSHGSHVANSQNSTISPPRTQTLLVTEYDIGMASRQTKMESLPPQEREKQEKWAQGQLSKNAGSCVMGFGFYRLPGGYHCAKQIGNHAVSDELLAEGKGGFYQRRWEPP